MGPHVGWGNLVVEHRTWMCYDNLLINVEKEMTKPTLSKIETQYNTMAEYHCTLDDGTRVYQDGIATFRINARNMVGEIFICDVCHREMSRDEVGFEFFQERVCQQCEPKSS